MTAAKTSEPLFVVLDEHLNELNGRHETEAKAIAAAKAQVDDCYPTVYVARIIGSTSLAEVQYTRLGVK